MSHYRYDQRPAQPGHFCKLWTGQNRQVEQHLRRLSPRDRQWRFGSMVSDGFIHEYCHGYNFFNPLAVGYFSGGVLRGIGEVYFKPDNIWFDHTRPWGRDCEAAISVEAEFQGQGVGSELFRRIVLLARNRGIESLSMLCLADNVKIQKIARHYAADFQRVDSQTEGYIHLDLPDFFTLMEESFDNAMALMRMPLNDGTTAATVHGQA